MTDRSDLEAKTRYDPSEVEPRIADAWLDSGLFHPEPAGSPEDNYSIADKALERETGARGLRSIIEEVLLEVQFELPSRRDVRKCVVTRDTIDKGISPTLVTVATPEEEAA